MKVTARFVCIGAKQIFQHWYRNEGGEQCSADAPGAEPVIHEEVEFTAIWTGHPEDNSYSEATPSGSLKMHISNPAVIGFFKSGEVYDLAITHHSKEA